MDWKPKEKGARSHVATSPPPYAVAHQLQPAAVARHAAPCCSTLPLCTLPLLWKSRMSETVQ